MRIIIGCALSMIFAANCVHAAAPVRDKPKAESRKPSRLSGLKLDAEQEVDGNVDYSKLVVKEIEKELKAKPSMAATGPSVFERPVSQEEQVRARAELERAKPKPRRRAVILPPHRSLKRVAPGAPAASAAPSRVLTIDIPASEPAKPIAKK